MKLFANLSNADYQDVLRGIGAMLDEQSLRDVRIWECDDGIIVQGRRPGDGEFETIPFNDVDLRALLESAAQRRRG